MTIRAWAWGASVAGLLAASTPGCGSDKTPEKSSSTEEAQSAPPSSAVGSGARPTTASQGAPAKIPDKVDDAIQAVPASANLVVTIPAPSSLGVPADAIEMLRTSVFSELAPKLGIQEATLRAAFDAFDGGAAFTAGQVEEKDPPFAFVLRFKDGKPIEDLIAEAKLEKEQDGSYVLKKAGRGDLRVRWLEKPRVLIASTKTEMIQGALDALGGAAASFKGSPHFKADPSTVFAFADLAALVTKKPDLFAQGSHVVGQLNLEKANVHYVQMGPKVPRIGNVFAPSSHEILAKLPAGPVLALDLSLARRPGKTLKDLFAEIARATGADFSPTAEKTLKDLAGLDLAGLDAALGDDIAAAAYLPAKLDVAPEKLLDATTVVFALGVKDDKAIQALFDGLKKSLPKSEKVKWGDAKVVLNDVEGRTVVIELQKGAVVAGFGDKERAEKLIAAVKKGDAPFGKTPEFAEYKTKAAATSSLGLFIDFNQVAKALPKDTPTAFPVKGVASSDLTIAESDGLDITLDGGAVMAAAGSLGAVAIYGVRTYLAAAKSAEAKNSIGAIGRAAVAAFEREQPGGAAHALCKSSTPVPSAPPKAKKYQPDPAVGKDFETGSATEGWKCLKFTISSPTYYQYEYHAGSGYKCPARGGVDPGPNGFEASAEGDLDGDGKTSLFCLTGKVDKGSVKLDTKIFVVDETE